VELDRDNRTGVTLTRERGCQNSEGVRERRGTGKEQRKTRRRVIMQPSAMSHTTTSPFIPPVTATFPFLGEGTTSRISDDDINVWRCWPVAESHTFQELHERRKRREEHTRSVLSNEPVKSLSEKGLLKATQNTTF
jgi:hypothetical protein